MKQLLKITALLLVFAQQLHCFTLHRAIIATDAHPNYIEFWPLVAQAWQEIVGIRPTLALIADKSVIIDETLGDVIRFEPIEGVPTSLYAQAIRLLLPALFEDEGCIISDIDMIPLSRDYFIDSVSNVPEDTFVVYRNKAYHPNTKQYPMCYCAAYGKVWKEIFNVNNIKDVPRIIKKWHELNLGWSTDELLLYHYLNAWNKFSTNCIKLDHSVSKRIDRAHWGYSSEKIKTGYYIDAHCLRPYKRHKKTIDTIMENALKQNDK